MPESLHWRNWGRAIAVRSKAGLAERIRSWLKKLNQTSKQTKMSGLIGALGARHWWFSAQCRLDVGFRVMLTLLIIQDLTDSTSEAAWEHGAIMDPSALPRGAEEPPHRHCLWFVRVYCKESPIRNSVWFWQACVFTVCTLFWCGSVRNILRRPSLYPVFAPLSVVLWGHCTFPASLSSWKPQQSIRLFLIGFTIEYNLLQGNFLILAYNMLMNYWNFNYFWLPR